MSDHGRVATHLASLQTASVHAMWCREVYDPVCSSRMCGSSRWQALNGCGMFMSAVAGVALHIRAVRHYARRLFRMLLLLCGTGDRRNWSLETASVKQTSMLLTWSLCPLKQRS